jgi:hypothetical protein
MFAGHVLDMINRIRENREMLNAHKGKKERLKSVMFKPLSSHYHESKMKDFSPEEKTKAILKIRAEYKKSRSRLLIIETPFFIIILGIFALFMYYMFKTSS